VLSGRSSPGAIVTRLLDALSTGSAIALARLLVMLSCAFALGGAIIGWTLDVRRRYRVLIGKDPLPPGPSDFSRPGVPYEQPHLRR
jgi:hypothetical protein